MGGAWRKMAKKKMSGEERKTEIALAARGEFAKAGFYGTSMRDIAKAANVSEALIYRHFPSKEVLYKEIYFYIDSQIELLGQYFNQHEPSTETLVRMVFALSTMIMSEMPGRQEDQKIFERLLVYSLLENTSFAKSVFEKYDRELTPLWTASVATAQKNGDMYEPLIDSVAKMWLSHHLIMAINFLHLSGESLFPYGGSKRDLILGMVIFILRGTGLKDETIRRHFTVESLEEIVTEIFA
jgi:AcrR family transcriptional regulator